MSFLYGCLPKFLFDSGDEISDIFHHFMGLKFVVVRNTSESKCWLGHLCLEKQYNLGIFPCGKGQVPFPNLSLEQRFLRMDVPLKKGCISTSKREVEGTCVTTLFYSEHICAQRARMYFIYSGRRPLTLCGPDVN